MKESVEVYSPFSAMQTILTRGDTFRHIFEPEQFAALYYPFRLFLVLRHELCNILHISVRWPIVFYVPASGPDIVPLQILLCELKTLSL